MNAALVTEITAHIGKIGKNMDLNRKGVDKALNFLFHTEFQKRAYWVAMWITKSSVLAEEAVQEAYASVLNRPLNFRNEDHMRNAFFIVVRRKAIALMRDARRRQRREEASAERTLLVNEAPEEAINSNELALAARLALDSLPVEEREAVALCYEQEMTREAASEVLGIPKTTLTHRVNRGIEKLRKTLVQQGFAVATPLVVGEALESIPLPPVPETLSAVLEKIRANPSLAGDNATSLSRRTLCSKPGSTAIAIWSTALITVVAVGAFVSIKKKIDPPKENMVVGEQVRITPRSENSEADNAVVIYDDDFVSGRLDPFWNIVDPAGQVTLNAPDYRSALVLRASGLNSPEKMKAQVRMVSKTINLRQEYLEIIVQEGSSFARSGKQGETVGDLKIFLSDEKGSALRATPYLSAAELSKIAGEIIKADHSGGKESQKGKIRMYVTPTWDSFVLDGQSCHLGKLSNEPKSVCLSIVLNMGESSGFCIAPIEHITVRRLKQMPKEIALKLKAVIVQQKRD